MSPAIDQVVMVTYTPPINNFKYCEYICSEVLPHLTCTNTSFEDHSIESNSQLRSFQPKFVDDFQSTDYPVFTVQTENPIFSVLTNYTGCHIQAMVLHLKPFRGVAQKDLTVVTMSSHRAY
ncbi:hypothetical protein PVK06_023463 [Gossypium arboreum]|uniref:Uncharacterized protein n=1 Tax=Gossypium arboreum TaxID=29729 RepID=A0ABR0PBD3_GOSAR|nr:hypothetical protein PVK06_023463 [Gossypium arboreum]